MDDDMVFDRINFLLEGMELPFDIRGIDDLEKFLEDKTNTRFVVYDDIKALYNELMNNNA